jgi:FtsP/CotA-like multicopper oxidase with cupredoxin domain
LEYAPNHVVSGYTYNDSVPGPVIEAEQGQTLIVRLYNRVAEPTTIHRHGPRVLAAMDGIELIQHPVRPGNEPVVDAEQELVLDDVKLNRHGRLARFGGWMQRHNAPRGLIRLLNGMTDATVHIAGGQVERWRVINASSSRYIRLSLGGREFRIIGIDGGLLEAPVAATEVLLAPADRADLAVGPFASGDRTRVRNAWLPDDRPGGWMYHCHILEHHAAGMMAHFELLPRLEALSPEPITT